MKPAPGLTIEQQPEPAVYAMLLCGEARGEGEDGMRAVAQVIENRLNHPRRFGDTVKSVCLRPWQFSCFNPNDPNRAKLLSMWESDPIAYGLAEKIVAEARAGYLPDTVGPSTHYCTVNLWGHDDSDRIATGHAPAWYSKQAIEGGITQEVVRIGHHVFGVTA